MDNDIAFNMNMNVSMQFLISQITASVFSTFAKSLIRNSVLFAMAAVVIALIIAMVGLYFINQLLYVVLYLIYYFFLLLELHFFKILTTQAR